MLVILYFGHRLSRVYNSYFQFPRVCCYIVGYFMSYYLKDCSKKRMAWTSFVIFTMCILMNGIRIYYKYVLDSTFYRFDCFEAYAHDLLALSLFFVYRLLFANIRKNRLFQLSDRYSYHIYLVHQLFILSPFSLMAVTKVRVVNWIIVVAAILLSAILLKLVSDAVQCCYSKKKKVLPRCNSL